MRLLLVLSALALGSALAAPQELFGLGGTLGRRTGGGASPDTRTQAGEDATPLQESGNTPNLFFDRPFFTDIFRRPFFPRVPSFSGLPSIDFFPDLTDLPDNYDNSTHEVKMVNGSRVEMNRTVSKTTNDNGGVFYTHVHTIRRLPESAPDADNNVSAAGGGPQESPEEADAQTPKSGTVPQGNSADNQVDPYEDFGLASGAAQTRPRRWMFRWLQDPSRRASTRAPALHNHPNSLHLPTDKITYNLKPKSATELKVEDEIWSNRVPTHSSRPINSVIVPKPTTRPISSARVPIINNSDIAVNYIGRVPRPSNPDAEIFDIDLVRKNEREYFEGLSQPIRGQPHASQPITSQPMLSRPLRSQLMYQPINSQPIFQPIRSQPMFQPIRSQPIRL
nr:uncharacterized protein LOC123768406 isoform X2 [Procambarus clarkii]